MTLQSVQRFDRGRLGKAEPTPSGGVRLPAYVARTGVQAYRMPDGRMRREYRPPEEVFHPDSIASYLGAPVTIGHPRHGKVTPSTYQGDAVGVVLAADRASNPADASAEYVLAKLDVNAERAVKRIGADLVENSVGYTCDFDPTPGVTPSGEKYDGVQRNIRVNHNAILEEGRARAGRGARVVTDVTDDHEDDNAECLRLDSDGNQIVQSKETPSMKFLINGKELEAGPELQAAIGALEAANTAAGAKAVAATKATEVIQGKLDAAEKAKADALAAVSPEKINALVSDEIDFRAQVSPILDSVDANGVAVKFDFKGKSRTAIKRAVVAKLDGAELKTDATDVYVDAYFDARMRDAEKAKKEAKDKADSSESYRPAPGAAGIKADDKLYLDEAAWSTHCASFHGKFGVAESGDDK